MACAKKIKRDSGILLAVIFALYSFMHEPAYSMGLDFGTPDPVTVFEPVITAGPLGAPVRVASYSEQLLIVSDYNSGTIFYVSKSDPSHVEAGFKVEGRALAVGYLGKDIIVGNETSGAVEVYNSSGVLQYTLNGTDTIKRPSDLAVDHRQKRIFVVDSRGHEIKVYQKKSFFVVNGRVHVVKVYQKKRFLDNFGADVLVNPVGIALDPSAELVYVSDHGDSTTGVSAAVYVFTYGGVKLDKMDSETFGFYRPRGLAFESGKLYVTDALAGEVTVIDVDSRTKLGVLGEYGSDPGQLVQPQDVTIDPDGGVVYVANKRLGRIERITTGENLP